MLMKRGRREVVLGAATLTAEGVKAIAMLLRERKRQVAEEGFRTSADDGTSGQLARAAATYAMPEDSRSYVMSMTVPGGKKIGPPVTWPYSAPWWKPGEEDSVDGRIRELVKAGALIVAEIERLLRLKAKGAR